VKGEAVLENLQEMKGETVLE